MVTTVTETAQGATGTAQGAPPPVVVPASQYLDNTVPKTTKRTETEVLVLSVVASKQDRATVRTNDKNTFQKLEEKARKGIDTKLDYFNATSVSDITSNTGFSGVQTNVKKLNRHFVEHQLDDVFTVPSTMTWDRANTRWQPASYAVESDLRKDYANVELDDLKHFLEYI